MNQWAFVISAYGLTGLATLGLIVSSFRAMRKAEADADAVKRRQ